MKEIFLKQFMIFLFFVSGFTASAQLNKKEDGEWVTLVGEVLSTSPQSFKMSDGENRLTIEVDDKSFDRDARRLRIGDDVIVKGRVDKNKWTKNTVEAAAVYVNELKTIIYANPADEEANYAIAPMRLYGDSTPKSSRVTVTGRVTYLAKPWLTVDTGNRKLKVLAKKLEGNVFENSEGTQLQLGDRVLVQGQASDSFYKNRHVVADYIEKQ